MALIDEYTEEELENIVKKSSSMKEVIDLLGYSTHSGSNNETVKSRLIKYNIDYSHFKTKTKMRTQKRSEQNIFIENSTASQRTLRRWYKKGEYTEYKCSICGLEPVWNKKPLTLILDHINGHNHDDRLENLRWVCPNCNQQLDTTGSKNKKELHKKENENEEEEIKYYYCSSQGRKEIKCYCSQCGKEISKGSKTGLCAQCANKKRRVCERPSREELKKLVRTIPFVKIAENFGVSDKAIAKWCVSENLPSRKRQINSYSDEEWEKI